MLLGSHVSCQGGLYKAVERAEELSCDCIQVFVTNPPRQWPAFMGEKNGSSPIDGLPTVTAGSTPSGDGGEDPIHISMNKPLRWQGYTLFQSGWGPQDGSEVIQSTFSVVRNPSDQWPFWATFVTTLGLLFAFLVKFYYWIRKQPRRSAREPEAEVVA